jgi:hypothetical protein
MRVIGLAGSGRHRGGAAARPRQRDPRSRAPYEAEAEADTEGETEGETEGAPEGDEEPEGTAPDGAVDCAGRLGLGCTVGCAKSFDG